MRSKVAVNSEVGEYGFGKNEMANLSRWRNIDMPGSDYASVSSTVNVV